jgi:D-psicose/D-tagatose/L-ribulose 3-epimerase
MEVQLYKTIEDTTLFAPKGSRHGTIKNAVHAYAWTNSWSNDTLDIIDKAKAHGFDLIEVPLMEIDKVNAAAIKERALAADIELCTSTASQKTTDPTGDDEATRPAGVLKQAAQYAQDHGVTVGIEDINRYETFLINTGDQALELMHRVDEPNVKVHLDAYHMNIEEHGFYPPTL